LQDLEVEPPLDVTALARLIGEYRGREIRLVAWPIKTFGYSFRADGYDVIVYQKNTSKPHQDHIICHELGHCICGHLDPESDVYWEDPTEDDEEADVEEVAPHLPFEGVPRRLRRSCYDSPHERAVELIANTFMEWAYVPGCAPQQRPDGLGDAETMYSSLQWKRGWL
jgi:hypothetical protein